MYQALDAAQVSNTGFGPGDHQYPPIPAHDQGSWGESSFFDSSGPIFSMYLGMAEEEDNKMAESWKADAEGILVFTGLFSAAVASLISVSIQDLRQNPQDTSNFYLANIYQALADPNRSNILNSLPLSPPPFSPPAYAIWVNSLWFLSLVISITCALLATLLQQWARRYLKATHTRYTLHKRARIRSFFAEGVENSLLPLAVEALPTLIHLSLFLFLAGLAVFLRNVNLTIFKVVMSWIGLCAAVYGCITVIPMFRLDSPYYTPLTPWALPIILVIIFLIWLLWTCFYALVLLFFLCFRGRGHEPDSFLKLHLWFSRALHITLETPEKVALNAPPEIDTRAVMWTFERLDEDHELEHFFSGLSSFRRSKVIKEPLRRLASPHKLQLLASMIRLLDRTFSSDFLLDHAKRHRVDICVNAIDLVETPGAFTELLRGLASEDEYGPVQSTETVQFVRRWGICKSEFTSLAQAIFSIIVARVQLHDDPWFILASSELGIPEAVLREHAAHGDSLSLVLLIYIVYQQLCHFQDQFWPSPDISRVLGAASKFNVQDTSPSLQHDFCTLWNQIVRKAQNDDNWNIAHLILRPIHQIYIVLHHDTDAAQISFSISTRSTDGDGPLPVDDPGLYPVCNVASHVSHNSVLEALTILHGNSASPSVSHPSPAASPLSMSVPLHVDNSRMTIPPLGMLGSPFPTYQTIKCPRIPVVSPNPDTVGAMIQDVVASGVTMSPTLETTTSRPPFPSTTLPAAVDFQHNSDFLAPSDFGPPSLLLSAANTVLDDLVLPAEPQLVTTSLSTSSGPTPALNLQAAAEDDCGQEHALRNEVGAPEAPTLNYPIGADTMATTDLQPQIASPSSVPNLDVAIASRSPHEPDARHTGHLIPDPSCHQHDMV